MSAMQEADLELIDRYLAGACTEAERAEVERRMAQEVAFAQQVNLLRELNRAIPDRSAGFQAALAGVMAEVEAGQATPKRMRVRWYYSAAAALVLLLGIGLALWLRPQPLTYQQLAMQRFTPPPSPFLLREGGATDSLLTAGAQAYERGDYRQAAQVWAALPSDHPRASQVRLYQGIARLAADQPDQAEALLAALRDHPEPEVAQSARWYLALTYLRQGQPAAAQPLLADLAQTQGSLAQRAQALLAELDKLGASG